MDGSGVVAEVLFEADEDERDLGAKVSNLGDPLLGVSRSSVLLWFGENWVATFFSMLLAESGESMPNATINTCVSGNASGRCQ